MDVPVCKLFIPIYKVSRSFSQTIMLILIGLPGTNDLIFIIERRKRAGKFIGMQTNTKLKPED